MTVGVSSTDQKTKLTSLIESCIYTLEEIKNTRAGMSEQINEVAADLDIPAKKIRQAIRMAHKNSLKEDREDFDDAIEILEISGRA